MNELVPFEQSDDRSYNQQMKDALEDALEIHGTVLNDLNQAMNAIIQMERAMGMTGTPNPYATVVQQLKRKYGMGQKGSPEWAKQQKQLASAQRLVESKDEPLELLEGEIVDD